jgi:hypothetical protein
MALINYITQIQFEFGAISLSISSANGLRLCTAA